MSLLILYYILCLGLPFGIFPLGFASQVSYPHVLPIVELFCHDHFSLPSDLSWSLSFTVLRCLFFTRPSCVSSQSYFPCFNCYKVPNYLLCCILYFPLLPRCCSFGIFSKYFPQLKWLPNCRESLVEWWWRGRIEVFGNGLVSLPLYPLQIPHGLAHYRTWASAVLGCQVFSHRSKLISQFCLQNSTLLKQCG